MRSRRASLPAPRWSAADVPARLTAPRAREVPRGDDPPALLGDAATRDPPADAGGDDWAPDTGAGADPDGPAGADFPAAGAPIVEPAVGTVAEAVGADTDGVDADGVDVDGVATDGAVTGPAVTAGVETDGTLTDGAVTDGAVTDGVETVGAGGNCAHASGASPPSPTAAMTTAHCHVHRCCMLALPY